MSFKEEIHDTKKEKKKMRIIDEISKTLFFVGSLFEVKIVMKNVAKMK